MPLTLPPPVIDQQLMEMRWRILSLAADLDRLDRFDVAGDARLTKLRESLSVLLSREPGRAEHVQIILSDMAAVR